MRSDTVIQATFSKQKVNKKKVDHTQRHLIINHQPQLQYSTQLAGPSKGQPGMFAVRKLTIQFLLGPTSSYRYTRFSGSK